MRNWIGIVLIAVVFVQPAWAQAPEPLPAGAPAVIEPDDVNRRELEKWIQEHTAWQEWAETWLNRRQWVLHPFPYPFWKGTASLFSYVAAPRVEPEPPPWLEAACVQMAWSSADRDPLAEGCPLLAIWKDDFSTRRIRAQIVKARAQKDIPTRIMLLEHMHFAGLWTDLQAHSGPSAYGLAGVHATIDIHGRWQIYAFPGVMAVSVPNRQGERITTIGYDWGFAVRLFDLRVPYFNIPAKAHINVVKVWVPEVGQKIDMVGFSFTLKKKP
jgi:hypothetical protein